MRSNKSGLSLPIPPHSMSLLTASISPTTSTSLSYYASPASTPPCTPPVSTLYFNPFLNPPGRGVGQSMTRQSSLSSVCSSNDEGEEDFEWTVEEQDRLRETFDYYTSHASASESPFSGLIPSNLSSVIAKSVVSQTSASNQLFRASKIRSGGEIDAAEPRWRHGMRSTRVKLLSIMKERQSTVDHTPRQGDLDSTPKRRKGIIRQGSMDFLPVVSNDTETMARLGSKLQSSAPSHPYPTSARGGRMARTNSLSSIAGSPQTAPKAAPPVAMANADIQAASNQMTRIGSVDQYAGRFKLRSAGSFSLGPPVSPTASTALSPRSEMANWSTNVALSTQNMSLDEEELAFATPTRPRTKRLGSAFHSPLDDVYPSPESMKKKKTAAGLGLSAIPGGPSSHSTKDDAMVCDDTYASTSFTTDIALSDSPFSSRQSQPRSSRSFSSAMTYGPDPAATPARAPHHPASLSRSISSLTHSPMSATFDLNDLSLETLNEGHRSSNGLLCADPIDCFSRTRSPI